MKADHLVATFVADSPRRLAVGTSMDVVLDQIIGWGSMRDPGPHFCGRATVEDDGRLAIWLTEHSEAGRTARALVADDCLDVSVEGSPPQVWLRA